MAKRRREVSPVVPRQENGTLEKETMTEISLMFNPFKSELKEHKPDVKPK